ncbi:MAG: hypothetical protein PVF45_00350 [Anaerolineae bacterium]
MKERLTLALIVAVVTIAGIVYAIVTTISPTALRFYAVLVTLALPLVGWAGWYIGRYAAQAYLSGLERGTDTVMHAAQKTADVRDRSAAMARAARGVPVGAGGQGVVLPELPPATITHRPRQSDKVIDL